MTWLRSVLSDLVLLARMRLATRRATALKRQQERINSKNADLRALLELALSRSREIQRQSTKHCPGCGDPNMVPLHSTNTKICPSCGTEIPWALTGDQKPTHQPHRAQRKAKQE